MSTLNALTGIKPSGTPHLGNYFGAIEPALKLVDKFNARYFIADYHALNTITSNDILKEYTYQVCASWLACGLDVEQALLYKQSSIPEIFELSCLLQAFTAKGLMNRAHAYKACVQTNLANDKDADYQINMGLFSYPILMAADILLFDTHVVPIGKDQLQHIEIATDIAQKINFNYKKELLVEPKAIINETTQVITGLDGRKMSKSYNNTIPLFLPSKQLRKLIMKIKTNSQSVEEKKDPYSCDIFALYKLFTNQEEQENLKERYLAGGMGWGHAKQELYLKIEEYFATKRDKYHELISKKEYLDEVLEHGATKARKIATAKMHLLRESVGFC